MYAHKRVYRKNYARDSRKINQEPVFLHKPHDICNFGILCTHLPPAWAPHVAYFQGADDWTWRHQSESDRPPGRACDDHSNWPADKAVAIWPAGRAPTGKCDHCECYSHASRRNFDYDSIRITNSSSNFDNKFNNVDVSAAALAAAAETLGAERREL